jgi:hypothetical protein
MQMYEDPEHFRSALSYFFTVTNDLAEKNRERLALDRWHELEARYPESLADWLTAHPDFRPPHEIGVRIGKRPDHRQGGRANLQF